MSKGFRTFLFVFFLAVFAIAAPALVFYAQGYRIDWPPESGKKLIVKTGGFFVKAYPKQIEIYINGELEKKTDFFFDSALVENLLPKKYKFEVKKTGWQTWSKNLEIKEKEVVEAPNVFLFPQKTDFSALEQNIDAVLPSPNAEKIALLQSGEAGWSVKMYDIAQDITVKLAGPGNFSGKDPLFGDWSWSNAQNLEIIIEFADTTGVYEIAVDKNPPQTTAKKTNGAAESSGDTVGIVKLAEQKFGQASYYLANDGFIYKQDPGQEAVKVTEAAIEIKTNADCALWILDNRYFAAIDSELFFFNEKTESFEKLLSQVSLKPEISPDGKKIVYCSNSEIWTLFLEDNFGMPKADAGDKVFIARFSEKVDACQWFDDNYLIFTAGDTIKAAEIDTRDKINIADIAKVSQITGKEENGEAQMFFDADKKIIYLFANKTLYKSAPIE